MATGPPAAATGVEGGEVCSRRRCCVGRGSAMGSSVEKN